MGGDMVTRGKPQSGTEDLGVVSTVADSWSGHSESQPLLSPSASCGRWGPSLGPGLRYGQGAEAPKRDRQVGICQASQDWSATYFSQRLILVIIGTTMVPAGFSGLTLRRCLPSILHVLIHRILPTTRWSRSFISYLQIRKLAGRSTVT